MSSGTLWSLLKRRRGCGVLDRRAEVQTSLHFSRSAKPSLACRDATVVCRSGGWFYLMSAMLHALLVGRVGTVDLLRFAGLFSKSGGRKE